MEQVMAVSTALLRPYLDGVGLLRGCEKALYALVEERHCFLPRAEAEQDPAYRQIIPYITLCRGDEVLCTRRLKKGGEARLHGLLSLGLGGHINALDGDTEGIFQRGLHRELAEEADYTPVGELQPLGVINDDRTEVGSVHLGFAFTLVGEKKRPAVSGRADGKLVSVRYPRAITHKKAAAPFYRNGGLFMPSRCCLSALRRSRHHGRCG